MEKGTFQPYLPIYIPPKMLPVCYGSISSDVVTALAHCKISFPSLFRCGLVCLFCSPFRKHKSTLFSSQPCSDCIHPFYLFVSRNLGMFEAEAATEVRMPSTMRHFVSYLLGAMTVFCSGCGLS